MLLNALPFAASLLFLPVIALAAHLGGWWLAVPFVWAFGVNTLLDAILGLNEDNLPPEMAERRLFWHRLITWIWPVAQTALIVGGLVAVAAPTAFSPAEQIALMAAIGLAAGGIGITYGHELMHQKNRFERALGDFLMIQVLYGHFRTEHILNHHRNVGTPACPVSARYGEGFWSFLPRAILGSFASAWRIEADRQRRRGRPAWGLGNPFWLYLGGAAAFLATAWAIAGAKGVALYVLMSAIAVIQLELVDYVEHYGLRRRKLDGGRYEHVLPRHSWNAAHRLTNYVLINLQRHSDHHYKPDRRFPLLQTYPEDEAPQLPAAYPTMIALAMVPPLWRRVMDPRVRAWRDRFYPGADWSEADAAGAA